jgi:hypothetical protein
MKVLHTCWRCTARVECAPHVLEALLRRVIAHGRHDLVRILVDKVRRRRVLHCKRLLVCRLHRHAAPENNGGGEVLAILRVGNSGGRTAHFTPRPFAARVASNQVVTKC